MSNYPSKIIVNSCAHQNNISKSFGIMTTDNAHAAVAKLHNVRDDYLSTKTLN